jgi:hypothetical protein
LRAVRVLLAGARTTGVGGLLGGERALAGDGLDAGDVELQHAQLLDAFLVAQALLEAEAEELLGGLRLLALQLFVTEVADLFEFHNSSSFVENCSAAVCEATWPRPSPSHRGADEVVFSGSL